MEEPHKEADLISRFRNGEDAALAELFDHYHDRLKRIVHFRLDQRMAGRVSESDVIQDAYVAALARVDHYREKQDMAFFVWLRLLLNQQMTDLHRRHLQAEKRDVRREFSIDQQGVSPHTSLAMAQRLVGNMTSPSRAFSRIEKIAKVEEALNRMEPIDREVIALRHFEELSNAETAEVLGIEVKTASKRYVRAMKRMRDILMGIPGFE